MEHNNQLDFQLKIFVLELDTIPTSAKTSPTVAMTTTSSAQPVNGYVTRTIDIFDVNQRDIDYRAEGNANIVLAIPQRCQVLRLPKKSKRLLLYSIVRQFISQTMVHLFSFRSLYDTRHLRFRKI